MAPPEIKSTASYTAKCRCGGIRRKGQRDCLNCHAKASLKSRAKNPLSKLQRLKMNARAYAHVYVKRGRLKKCPCFECGNPKTEIHHPDYNQPLLIIWLCRKHHLEYHRQ